MYNLIPETDQGHLNQSAINIYNYSCEINRPSYIYKPKLSIDGNQWCALYGENIQEGVVGFGVSPEKAYEEFDKEWTKSL
jgi:hypothetical protein